MSCFQEHDRKHLSCILGVQCHLVCSMLITSISSLAAELEAISTIIFNITFLTHYSIRLFIYWFFYTKRKQNEVWVVTRQQICCSFKGDECVLSCVFRSCQSMTSLFSNTVSPVKEGSSSLPRRASALSKPPLRALYDLLIAPMEGVRLPHFSNLQQITSYK